MGQKTDRSYASAPFEKINIDLEQRLENKLNVVISSINSNKIFKELITYFIDKNQKS